MVRRLLGFIAVSVLLTGCSTSGDLHQARLEFSSGAPLQALHTLETADVLSRDKLLVLLDQGAIAFSAGQYTRAQNALLDANDLIESWDQLRIGEEAATLATSEWAKRYRGEYSEQLWVHSYLMMVFLMQDRPESAAVEARRALQRMDEHKKALKIDWFTRALIALSFEAAGAHDSAQVEYRKLANDAAYNGDWDHVIDRHSDRLGRDPITVAGRELSTPTELGNDEGELVLFLQSGRIARKLPGDITIDIDLRISFPYYAEFPRSKPVYTVLADGESVPLDQIDTQLIDVSKRALSARGNSMTTRQIARIAAKKALVDVADNEDAALGAVIQLLMFATEQADTRSWETLPGWFGLLRVPLPEGDQEVVIKVDHHGVEHRIDLGTVNIRAGKKRFAAFRTDQPLPLRDGAPLPLVTSPTAPDDTPAPL